MSDKDEEEFVIVGKNVYAAALELLRNAADMKEDPVILAKKMVADCKKIKDETGIKFWSDVQKFLTRTGVKTVEQLIPFSPSDTTH